MCLIALCSNILAILWSYIIELNFFINAFVFLNKMSYFNEIYSIQKFSQSFLMYVIHHTEHKT